MAAVNARVTELRQTASTGAIVRAELDREFVLRELVENALKAKQQGQWAASIARSNCWAASWDCSVMIAQM